MTGDITELHKNIEATCRRTGFIRGLTFATKLIQFRGMVMGSLEASAIIADDDRLFRLADMPADAIHDAFDKGNVP